MSKYNWDERHIITFPEEKVALSTKDLHVYYGKNESIKGVDMQFEKNKITALIGPSGSGKSTYLRSLNRMNDTIDIAKVTGQILYRGIDINRPEINVYEMRKHIGMVFQRPNPFAKSIQRNITFAHERAGVKDKQVLDEIVETSLRQAALWDQVKDDLHKSALTLSGGQQQRLCIARAISVKPDILLMDEPASALDPIATAQLEETMLELKKDFTIIIVTHSMQQAARASDYTGFFYLGDLIEYDKTSNIFQNAKLQSTNDYVTGHFGQKGNSMTEPILQVSDLSVYYNKKKALNSVSLSFQPKEITALIGPSGSGKSTLLKAINRMGDLNPEVTTTGSVVYNGHNIYSPRTDTVELRKEIGMVFQQPNPFPMSIYENVVYGLRINGEKDKNVLDEAVEKALQRASIWDEVKDRLHDSAIGLSGGQQQRVCVARVLATSPKIILLDEPTSALDPISAGKIEETLYSLKDKYTMLLVTRSMQQASRISDKTGFFLNGDLIEFNDTKEIFLYPQHKETEDYISGKFG